MRREENSEVISELPNHPSSLRLSAMTERIIRTSLKRLKPRRRRIKNKRKKDLRLDAMIPL